VTVYVAGVLAKVLIAPVTESIGKPAGVEEKTPPEVKRLVVIATGVLKLLHNGAAPKEIVPDGDGITLRLKVFTNIQPVEICSKRTQIVALVPEIE